MMEKIEVKKTFEIEVKRFHLPIIIKRKCPNCSSDCELDLNSDYISYPIINKKERITFYCDGCNINFEVDSILRISLEVDNKTHKV